MHLKFYFSLFFISALFACQKQVEKISWDVDVLAPLVKSNLSIKNLVADSNYTLAEDSSVSLEFFQTLDSLSLKGLNEFKIAPFYKKIKLSSLQLVTDTIVQKISLGQIAQQLAQSTDQQARIIGFAILASHGSTLESIPNFDNIRAEAIPLDISQWFKYALLRKAILKVSLDNQLPIAISNIEFQLKNQTLEPQLVFETAFQNILPGQFRVSELGLENKKVEGQMNVAISDLDLLGSNNVKIDTNDALLVKLVISNIELEEAEAVFPAQNVIVDTVPVPITMVEGVEAKETILESGIVRIKVLSTLRDSLFYTYKIPNATTPSGQKFEVIGKIPPSISGTAQQYEYIADFKGFKLNLTGADNQDTVNTFFSDFTAAIKYTGKPVFLSLINDSLEISITLENLKPSYLRGSIAQDTLIKGVSDFDFFKNISATLLDFNSIRMDLQIKNTFGINALLTPESIGVSKNADDWIFLNDPELINQTKQLSAAKAWPIVPSFLNLSTNKAAPLLNVLPQRVSYAFRVKTGSANASVKTYDDFAYLSSAIVPQVKITAPLNFSAKDLILTDTLKLSNDFFTKIQQGAFKLTAQNTFPVEMKIQLVFLNQNLQSLLSLSPEQLVQAAPLNMSTGKSSATSASEILFILSTEQLNLLKNSTQVLLKASFSTQPEQKRLKFYDSYHLDIQLVGDFKYKIQ
jgi:hypothetical protein